MSATASIVVSRPRHRPAAATTCQPRLVQRPCRPPRCTRSSASRNAARSPAGSSRVQPRLSAVNGPIGVHVRGPRLRWRPKSGGSSRSVETSVSMRMGDGRDRPRRKRSEHAGARRPPAKQGCLRRRRHSSTGGESARAASRSARTASAATTPRTAMKPAFPDSRSDARARRSERAPPKTSQPPRQAAAFETAPLQIVRHTFSACPVAIRRALLNAFPAG